MSKILKWAGGKTDILDEILSKFPKKINNYIEPFAGGGSVFIGLLNEIEKGNINVEGDIIVNDLNKNLICLFTTIKDNLDLFTERMDKFINIYNSCENVTYPKRHKHEIGNDADVLLPDAYGDVSEINFLNLDNIKEKGKVYFYYLCRNIFNKHQKDELNLDIIEISCLFLFLNKTCFRGLYRESKNKFNVPFGNYKKPTFFKYEVLENLNYLFNKYDVKFSNNDYKKFITLEPNDFFYIDPPYYPLNKKSFTSYNGNSWKEDEEHINLFNFCNELNNNDIMFLHSNSFCDFNLDWYKDFSIDKILCKRRINSKKPGSEKYEVLIRNY